MNTILGLSVFAAVLGMFQFGFNTGVINSPQIYIERFINQSYFERDGTGFESPDTVSLLFSVAVSSCLVGGMIGGLSGGWVADKLGRRNGLWASQWLSVLGAALMGACEAAGSYEMLVIGRFSIGLACGLFTGLVPLYITEIAPVEMRGGLGTLNQLAVTSGILCSQILGLDVVLGSQQNWPILLALGGVVPASLQLILLPFMPESPKYLILNKGKIEEGKAGLRKLRGTDQVEMELEMIKMSEQFNGGGDGGDSNDATFTIKDLFKTKSLHLPLLICVMMHLSQQLSGMVAIFYYSTKFFINAGVPEDSAQYATMGVGAIMVAMTVVTIPLMDRVGRRSLHLIGLLGIVVFSVLITIASTQNDEADWVAYFLIAATFGFVVFFALGPGSIPWMITGELFEQEPRPAAIAVATVVNWTANLIVGLTFPALESAFNDFTFLFFGLITAVLFIFLFFYLPETKGKTTSAISQILTQDGAWKASYNKGKLFRQD